MPWRRSMFQTLLGDSEIPSPTSSPWIRLYPQVGFSAARRRTSWRACGAKRGRPGGRPGYVQRRRMSSRCQRNSVAGWTRNENCRARGRTRVSAASTARSAAPRRGRATCRLSTCNSWRRIRISTSFAPVGATQENEQLEQAADSPVDEGEAFKQQTLSSHLPTVARAGRQAPPQSPATAAKEHQRARVSGTHRPCPACGLQVRDLRRRDLTERAASPGIDQQGHPAALDRSGGPLCDPLPLERRPLSGHLHVRASARALRVPDLRCRSTSTIEARGAADPTSGVVGRSDAALAAAYQRTLSRAPLAPRTRSMRARGAWRFRPCRARTPVQPGLLEG
jgi:hypothetical protein